MPPRQNKILKSNERPFSEDEESSISKDIYSRSTKPSELVSPATDLQYQIETAYDTNQAGDRKWISIKSNTFK